MDRPLLTNPLLHDADYIDFLRSVTPGNAEDHLNQLRRFNMGQVGDVDCPVFDGVYEYCQVCPVSLSSPSLVVWSSVHAQCYNCRLLL